MQKTSSNASHIYKPLPKKERSQLFHLCFPVRRCGAHHRASVFLLPLTLHWPFHRLYPQSPCAHLYMSTWGSCCPGLKWSLPTVHTASCTSPEYQKAFASSVEHALASAPTFLLQRKWTAHKNFSSFFPVFTLFLLLFVSHKTIRWHLEQDSKWC